jgi:hypothetical protein
MDQKVFSQINVQQNLYEDLPLVVNGELNPDPHASVFLIKVVLPANQNSGGSAAVEILGPNGKVFKIEPRRTSKAYSLNGPPHSMPLENAFVCLSEDSESSITVPWDKSRALLVAGINQFADGGAIRVRLAGSLDGVVIRIFQSLSGGETDVGQIYGGPADAPHQKGVDITVNGMGTYELIVPFSVAP